MTEKYVLVPVAPTQEMIDAFLGIGMPRSFECTTIRIADFSSRYRSMISVSPKDAPDWPSLADMMARWIALNKQYVPKINDMAIAQADAIIARYRAMNGK